MWEWDSTLITFDQTCWFYDGVYNCVIGDTANEIILFNLYISKTVDIMLLNKVTETIDLSITQQKEHTVKIQKQLESDGLVKKTFLVT